ncbi:Protease inhibitor Inh [Serratia sp. CC22-02]|nr:Protease inhibitor Inh [Serratia sp. CC22-02]
MSKVKPTAISWWIGNVVCKACLRPRWWAGAWRPAPDGIALLRADGSTLAFFSRDGDLYRNQLGADDALTLKALA